MRSSAFFDLTNTSFIDSKIITDINPERARVKTISEEISGDWICAFIWDSINGLRPLSDVIELK